MSTNTTLDTGLRWIEQGVSVIPIAYRSKLPDSTCLRWTGNLTDNGASWSVFQKTLTTRAQLETWTKGPRINLAVVTGWQGLVILDFDTCDAWEMYRSWLKENALAQQVVDLTFKVLTGRGVHVYLSIEEPVKNSHVGVIDIKAGGGYVLTPPSVHPTGRVYTAVDPKAPVVCVERLADVFPFEPEEAALSSTGILPPATERLDDPLDAAEHITPGNLVERVKRAYRVEDMFKTVYSTGNGWLVTHCPLHDDSSPSFWIDTEKQLCGCYAGCTRQPLDVINLYARTRRLSNGEALRELAMRM